MKFKKLGNTDLEVSLICLGTMTWGEQNTQEEAFEQMDYAIKQGINFFDTAEMYAVPSTEETFGKTETIIGNWFKERSNRKKVILATKISPGTILAVGKFTAAALLSPSIIVPCIVQFLPRNKLAFSISPFLIASLIRDDEYTSELWFDVIG